MASGLAAPSLRALKGGESAGAQSPGHRRGRVERVCEDPVFTQFCSEERRRLPGQDAWELPEPGVRKANTNHLCGLQALLIVNSQPPSPR